MAGTWVLVQAVLALAFATRIERVPFDHSWRDLGYSQLVLAAHLFGQFPASLVAIPVAVPVAWGQFVPEAKPLDGRMAACFFIATACLNYVFRVHWFPALANRIEARWPFEQLYFRRKWPKGFRAH